MLAKMEVLVAVVAACVAVTGFLQAPKYEAGAQALTGKTDPDSRPVAEEVVRRLELDITPDELLSNLGADRMGGSGVTRLTYEDTDPKRAQEIVNAAGRVSSRGPLLLSATEATPVGPHPVRNGLLTFLAGLVLLGGYKRARFGRTA
jgi:capsular polysaccharide biosynthesis protein